MRARSLPEAAGAAAARKAGARSSRRRANIREPAAARTRADDHSIEGAFGKGLRRQWPALGLGGGAERAAQQVEAADGRGRGAGRDQRRAAVAEVEALQAIHRGEKIDGAGRDHAVLHAKTVRACAVCGAAPAPCALNRFVTSSCDP
jgi:hypothetical protein